MVRRLLIPVLLGSLLLTGCTDWIIQRKVESVIGEEIARAGYYFTPTHDIMAEVEFLDEPRYHAVLQFRSKQHYDEFFAIYDATETPIWLVGPDETERLNRRLPIATTLGTSRESEGSYLHLFIATSEELGCGDKDGNYPGSDWPCEYDRLRIRYKDGKEEDFDIGAVSVPKKRFTDHTFFQR